MEIYAKRAQDGTQQAWSLGPTDTLLNEQNSYEKDFDSIASGTRSACAESLHSL